MKAPICLNKSYENFSLIENFIMNNNIDDKLEEYYYEEYAYEMGSSINRKELFYTFLPLIKAILIMLVVFIIIKISH